MYDTICCVVVVVYYTKSWIYIFNRPEISTCWQKDRLDISDHWVYSRGEDLQRIYNFNGLVVGVWGCMRCFCCWRCGDYYFLVFLLPFFHVFLFYIYTFFFSFCTFFLDLLLFFGITPFLNGITPFFNGFTPFLMDFSFFYWIYSFFVLELLLFSNIFFDKANLKTI